MPANFTLVTFSSLTRYSNSAVAQASASFCAAAAGIRSERPLDAHRRPGPLVDQVRRLLQQVRGAHAHFAILETVKQVRTHLDADFVADVAKRQAAIVVGNRRALERHAEDRSLCGGGGDERRNCANGDE